MTNSQSSSMKGIESLPMDLITKILAYLPAKSVGKFRCVSKLWSSTLSQPYFTDLFLTSSSARPRILFSLQPHNQRLHFWPCLSSPQPPNPDEHSSIAVHSPIGLSLSCAVSGLILCLGDKTSDNILDSRIGNPTTGEYVDLPILKLRRPWPWTFFGYDPIGKQYKIMCMSEGPGGIAECYHLLTFPCKENESWRSIQCPTRYRPFSSGICINGILYYVARKEKEKSLVIVCFDVRSEEFKFIYKPDAQFLGRKRQRSVCLSNFNGKLVSICWLRPKDTSLGNGGTKLDLCVWVLEDDKKQEWSKHNYHLKLPVKFFAYVVGMISTGEIVLSTHIVTSDPFYVFYFNPERKTLRKVEIQGIEVIKDHSVTIFLDHVENVSFIA